MYTNLQLSLFLAHFRIRMTNVKKIRELKSLFVKKLKAPKRGRLRRLGAFGGYIRKRSRSWAYQFREKLLSNKINGIGEKDVRVAKRVRR